MTHPVRSRLSTRSARSTVGTVMALAVGLLLALLPLGTAEAAHPGRADRAADWQTSQLNGGRMLNVQFDSTDWGLTVDTYLALTAAGNHPRRARRVIATVSENVRKYVSFQGDFFAGPLAKSLLAREVAGLDATIDSANLNLRRKLRGRIADSGRVRDQGGSDFSNTLSQSLSVIALARSGSLHRSTVRFLVRQQCNGGYFRLQMQFAQCRRGTPDVDATAYAVQALVRARSEGVNLPRGTVRSAARWLVRAQGDNGSFSEQPSGGANTNSTGLAAQALKLVGRDPAARQAGRWVTGLQLTRAKAAGTPARRDLGAIAFNRADLRLAKRDGITATKRDVWRRATPQALFALTPKPLTTLRAS